MYVGYGGREYEDIEMDAIRRDAREDARAIEHQYWKHLSSGEVYAVMVKDERAYIAAGPLAHAEVTAKNLDEWNSDYTRLKRSNSMYKYPLTTSQEARSNLDRKAANDGYEDANADYPHALSSEDVQEQANNHVNAALGYTENWIHKLVYTGRIKAYTYDTTGALIVHEPGKKRQGQGLYFYKTDLKRYKGRMPGRPMGAKNIRPRKAKPI